MKFWDTSALVPLFVDEPETDQMRRVLAQDPHVLVWMLTTVELMSTFARLGRTATGLDDLIPLLRREALDQAPRWTTVTAADLVRRRAERLVGVHPLAAADAMQLAAALVAANDRPDQIEFVTLDRTLARCAQLEGFRTIPGARPARIAK